MAYIDINTLQYPILDSDLRQLFPNRSIGIEPPEGYARVEPEDNSPAVGRWQSLREGQPVLMEGKWRQQWEVYDLPLSLDDRRAEIKRDADAIACQKRNLVVSGISPAEMASWPIKRAEALAYQASGNATDAPNVAAEATVRGIALAALVGKVLTKAGQLADLEAAIAGRCGAIQDAANAALTLESESEADAALRAIDLDAGWPV
ncbi:MAG TPA: hypothetical protein VJ603_00990 [Paucimonas sp.]|nr:hypothetical protein [Paucimonas sp.]